VVTVEAGGRKVVRDIAGARGYLSQSELPITVGLGVADKVDRLTVRWPAGANEDFDVKAGDQVVELKQGAGRPAK
jgi:enediyne biosynthesis protein E4